MRLARNLTEKDCGPVALYNTHRIMGTSYVRGGYKANRAKLARACRYHPKQGVNLGPFGRALRNTLRPYGITARRMQQPTWGKLVSRLAYSRAPRVAVLATAKPDLGTAHVYVAWFPASDTQVLFGANLIDDESSIAPVLVDCRDGRFFLVSETGGSKLLGAWQILT